MYWAPHSLDQKRPKSKPLTQKRPLDRPVASRLRVAVASTPGGGASTEAGAVTVARSQLRGGAGPAGRGAQGSAAPPAGVKAAPASPTAPHTCVQGAAAVRSAAPAPSPSSTDRGAEEVMPLTPELVPFFSAVVEPHRVRRGADVAVEQVAGARGHASGGGG